MKLKICKPIHSVISGISLLALAAVLLTGCPAERQIRNPYQSVDWSRYGQYKANLHTHTMVTDGWMNPQTVVEKYRERGYRLLAITDHCTVTYPRQQFSKFSIGSKADQRIKQKTRKPKEDEPISPGDAEFRDVDPARMGMVDIPGGEFWFRKHELNVFFADDYPSDTERFLDTLGTKSGIACLNHPGRYQFLVAWYTDQFRRYNHLVGLEVFNCGNRYPNDRRLWDSILTEMASVRPVWGFSNDDMHSMRDLGRNWNVFLLPEADRESIRHAMENGVTYFIYAPKGHRGVPVPTIRSIRVSAEQGSIRMEASDYQSIVWISHGQIVHKGKKFPIKKLPPGGKYVRAELHGAEGSIVCTQPFILCKNEEI